MGENDFKTRFADLLSTKLKSCRFSSGTKDYSARELRERYLHDRDLVNNDVWVKGLTGQTAEPMAA